MSTPVPSAIGTGHETSPTPPTHAAGNLLLLFVESPAALTSTDPPTDWLKVPCPPIQFSTTCRLTAYYQIAPSGAVGNPTIGAADHAWGTILTVQGADPTRPIRWAAGMSSTSSTAGTFPATETDVAECLIVNVLAYALDNAAALASGEANADLGSVTEQYDAGTVTGNGGGLVIITGTKAAAGSVAETRTTLSTTSAFASMTLVIQPPQAAGGDTINAYSKARLHGRIEGRI